MFGRKGRDVLMTKVLCRIADILIKEQSKNKKEASCEDFRHQQRDH